MSHWTAEKWIDRRSPGSSFPGLHRAKPAPRSVRQQRSSGEERNTKCKTGFTSNVFEMIVHRIIHPQHFCSQLKKWTTHNLRHRRSVYDGDIWDFYFESRNRVDVSLLKEKLDEEKETDQKLTELSKEINLEAQEGGSEREERDKHKPRRAA